MKLFLKFLFSFLIISTFSQFCYGQNKKIDSLRKLTTDSREDTVKVNQLLQLAYSYKFLNSDSVVKISEHALLLSKKIKYDAGIASAYINMGWGNYLLGNYSSALDFYSNANNLLNHMDSFAAGDERKKALKMRAKTLTYIAEVYSSKGDYPVALDYSFRALRQGEALNDDKILSTQQASIASVYRDMGQYENALTYFLKALDLADKCGNKNLLISVNGNIGLTYFSMGNYEKALEYDLKAMEKAEAAGQKIKAGIIYGNVGSVYSSQARLAKKISTRDSLFNLGLSYYAKALDIAESAGDLDGISRHSGNIGATYTYMGDYSKARTFLSKGLEAALSSANKENIMYRYSELARLDSTCGNFKEAYDYYLKYTVYKDSLTNEENTKKETQAEMNYEFDKKEAAAKALQEKKDTEAKAEQDKKDTVNRIIIYSISSGMLLVLALAFFIYRSYRQKQKANHELAEKNFLIEEQKKIVEEKNKDILDSIQYARRIQQSLLPTEKYIDKNLNRMLKDKN